MIDDNQRLAARQQSALFRRDLRRGKIAQQAGTIVALWGSLIGLPTDDIDSYEDFIARKIACLGISTSRMWGVPPPDSSSLTRRLNLALA